MTKRVKRRLSLAARLTRFTVGLLCVLVGIVIGSLASPARAERIKDLATIQGVRPNQLIGYGLVVGLDGTGDQTTQTPFTVQSIASMLSNMGVNIPPGTSLQLKNVAAVMVTTQMPAFARPEQLVDVTVSSLGNAKSLRGGTLLLTPLKGADGQIYAMAQGNVVIAGAGASAGGSKVQVNQLNAGRVPGGATVERAVASAIAHGDSVQLELTTRDFTVARLPMIRLRRAAASARSCTRVVPAHLAAVVVRFLVTVTSAQRSRVSGLLDSLALSWIV
jgi:flagellar P-ring protein precursor FlgI